MTVSVPHRAATAGSLIYVARQPRGSAASSLAAPTRVGAVLAASVSEARRHYLRCVPTADEPLAVGERRATTYYGSAMGSTEPPPESKWLIEEWTGSGWRRVGEVLGEAERDRLLQQRGQRVQDDDEAKAIRAIGRDDRLRRDVPPLCPRCQRGQVFWTSDNKDCPLCERRGRSGSWVICDTCAEEAGVCVFDAAPVDGSSEEAVPWLEEVIAAARRERQEGMLSRPRGTGRYSKSCDYR